MGRGMSGHIDGHIYKRQANRPLPQGSRWTAVVDIRGGLKGAPVFIKEWEAPTGIADLKDLNDPKGLKSLGNLKGDCFDLSGRKVENPQKGVYIIRGNNASYKVLKQ